METNAGKQHATAAFGGVVALARALTVSSSAVSQWDRIPVARAKQVYALLKGTPKELSLHQLRPDIWSPGATLDVEA